MLVSAPFVKEPLVNRFPVLATVAVLLPATLCAALPSPVTGAQLLRVPQNFARVTDALLAAASGDTVEVAPGVYSPSTNGESFPLTIVDPSLTLRGAGMGISILDAGGASGVLSVSGPGAQVTGFTITGGRAVEGGGIFIADGSGAPEIARNLLLSNGASVEGSGIYASGTTSPWIHHNVIWESYDLVLASGGDPHGIQLAGANGTVENNLLGRGDSNALFNAGAPSAPIVRNNILMENGTTPTPFRGRGFCALGSPQTVIAHNLFHANVVAALLVRVSGTPTDMSGAQANALSPSDPIYGNLDADPMLRDPDVFDFELEPGSPAINAGDPASPNDADGTRADIGPFFFDHRLVDAGGRPNGRVRLTLRASPNPGPGRTTFSFDLPRAGEVRLELYDGRGARLASLHEGGLAAGAHSIAWNGRDDAGNPVAPGLYFARLELDGERVTNKLLLWRSGGR